MCIKEGTFMSDAAGNKGQDEKRREMRRIR